MRVLAGPGLLPRSGDLPATVVAAAAARTAPPFPAGRRAGLLAVLLAGSVLSYRYVELPAQALGKRVAGRLGAPAGHGAPARPPRPAPGEAVVRAGR